MIAITLSPKKRPRARRGSIIFIARPGNGERSLPRWLQLRRSIVVPPTRTQRFQRGSLRIRDNICLHLERGSAKQASDAIVYRTAALGNHSTRLGVLPISSLQRFIIVPSYFYSLRFFSDVLFAKLRRSFVCQLRRVSTGMILFSCSIFRWWFDYDIFLLSLSYPYVCYVCALRERFIEKITRCLRMLVA